MGKTPLVGYIELISFFLFNHTTPQHKLFIVSFHMEGNALIWFKEIERSGAIIGWEAFERALLVRFGP